jgi:hypothetical protein
MTQVWFLWGIAIPDHPDSIKYDQSLAESTRKKDENRDKLPRKQR